MMTQYVIMKKKTLKKKKHILMKKKLNLKSTAKRLKKELRKMWDQIPIEERNKYNEVADEKLRIYNQQIESLQNRADDLAIMGMSYS